MSTALPSLDPLYRLNAKRTRDVFEAYPDEGLRDEEHRCVSIIRSALFCANTNFSTRLRIAVKMRDEYKDYRELPAALMSQQGGVGPSRPKGLSQKMITSGGALSHGLPGVLALILFRS